MGVGHQKQLVTVLHLRAREQGGRLQQHDEGERQAV